LVHEIGAKGLNDAFRDPRTGENLFTRPSNLMSIERDGRHIGSTAVERKGENLRVKFGESGIEAQVHVKTLSHYPTFELVFISDPASFIQVQPATRGFVFLRSRDRSGSPPRDSAFLRCPMRSVF
jgi:hypothetical protein